MVSNTLAILNSLHLYLTRKKKIETDIVPEATLLQTDG